MSKTLTKVSQTEQCGPAVRTRGTDGRRCPPGKRSIEGQRRHQDNPHCGNGPGCCCRMRAALGAAGHLAAEAGLPAHLSAPLARPTRLPNATNLDRCFKAVSLQ